MAVFRYELRQMRGDILSWTLAMGILIFLMLPTYIGFMTIGMQDKALLSGNPFLETIGASMKYLKMPMGVYGFLNSFAMLAAAIGGMRMGIATFTKEYRQKTADFLMTKPYARTRIYLAKLSAALCGSLIIWCGYLAGSVAAVLLHVPDGRDWKSFFLIALAFLLIQLFFLGMGALAGTLFPRIRAPLGTAAACVFVCDIIGSFSRKTGVQFTRFFAPFFWFDNVYIFENGGYAPVYMGAFVVFLTAFFLAGWQLYRTRDVILTA